MARYTKPETFGIHNNLRKIIKESGGMDVEYAACVFMAEYGLEDTMKNFNLAMQAVVEEDIRQQIEQNGLENTMTGIELKQRIDQRRWMEMMMLASKSSILKY